MIKGIVYSFFKFTAASRIQGFQPCPEFIPDDRFCFQTFLFPFFPGKFFIKTFQIEETVTESHSFFSRKQSVVFGSSFRWFCKFLFRINVQKLQLFLACLRNCFKELTSAVCKTADQDDIIDPAVCTIPITMEHSSETRQELYWIVPAPSGPVIIQYDGKFSVCSTQVDPHIRL